MSERVTNLVQNYIAVWNERDAGKRRRLIDDVFSDECVYIDPNDSVAGREAIERLVEALQARLPDLRFTLAGDVNAHWICHAVAPALRKVSSET
jgi:hypothetical protein